MNRVLQEGVTVMLLSNREFEASTEFEEDDAARQLKSLNLSPDVVLLDLGIENTNNPTLRIQLRQENPAAKIIVIDTLPYQMNIVDFVQSGGHALILKNTPVASWRSALIDVARGANVFSPLQDRFWGRAMVSEENGNSSDRPCDMNLLTGREQEIVSLLADGLSNKEIAEILHIASFAVKSHVHFILEKLKLNTRLQVAAYIRRKSPL